MAKRIFQVTGFTFTATSDSVVLVNNTFMSIAGATSSQRLDVLEVYWGGLAATSAVTLLQLARTAVAGSTTTALVSPNSDGPMDTATAALVSPPWCYTQWTNNPAVSAATTDARLNLAGNTFGGIVRWNASPTQQWTITGSAVPATSVLRASNAASGVAAVVSAHIIYEPY